MCVNMCTCARGMRAGGVVGGGGGVALDRWADLESSNFGKPG